MADFLPFSNITVASRTFFLLIGIASTAFLSANFAFVSANFAFPYIVTFCSSLLKNCASPLYLFIALNFIILIIWKLDRNPISVTDDVHVAVNKEILSADDDDNPKSVMISPTLSDQSMGKNLDPEPSSSQILAIEVETVNKSTEQHPWLPPEPVPEEINESSDTDNYSQSSSPDSIDATWWGIMSSKASTIKKQLKKSDTWEKTNTAHDVSRQDRPKTPPVLTRALVVDHREFKKSDTFRDRASAAPATPPPAGALIVDKREMRRSKTFRETTRTSAVTSTSAGWRGRDVLVVGSDELFRKVEAFIKMNYDQMRVKRQEPGQHPRVEMMNAAY